MPRKPPSGNRPSTGEARAWLLLLLLEEPAHGWALLNRMREFGLDTEAGTLYQTLRGLEAEGCVESDWQRSVGGPERRTYTITDQGRSELEQHSKQLVERRRALTRFIKHHRVLTARPLAVREEPAVEQRPAL